ncbi:hypothetical protein TRFO_02320 [Tritrichomonas foetus]|uniref:Sec1 family protein n=1 Tax=Tritrichomonas foetus TaxID=1144522 RepID=A0A1J4J8S6_9EUKA|nr:hypothetical protein TRFO_02320 [Tritrichomonas foetus]|eukprot:OHS93805.1 hypothetical protein TRFO_02320 [Tritrichomonas foetus]
MIKIPFGNEEKQFSINFHGNPMKSNEMDSSFHNYIQYRLLDHDNAYLQTILKNISQSKTRTDDKESTTTVSANGKIYNIIECDELEKSINKFLDLVNEAFTRMDKFDAYKKLREQLNYGLGLDFENFSSTIRTMLYAEENCVFASQLIMAQCVLGDKGLQQNFIDEFRDELELRYGAQIGEQLMMLEKLQLLCTKRTGKTFSQLNEHFNLCLNLDSNEQEQNDGNISSAENTADEYSGYVPLSVRIIQTDFETEKSTLKELNDYFPDQYEDGGKIQPNETTLVFFLGGITHLELAWLNWLTERHMNGMANIVVLTTDIFTSERFVKQCLPCLAKDHPSLKEMTDCALHMQSTGNFLSLNDK